MKRFFTLIAGLLLAAIMLQAQEQFQFEVTTTAAGQSFSLPTSGGISGKNYNWNINWGDGETETKSGSSNYSSAGIAHSYAAAGTHTIIITPAGSTNAWFAAFGFYNNTDGANAQANKDMLTKVISSLTPLMTRTQAQIDNPTDAQPNYEWAYTFYGCGNLSMGDDFTFAPAWNNISEVGDSFADHMFYNCSGSAFNMNAGFNLPTGITTVGDYFAQAMFSRCSGSAFTMNAGFNLPTGITSVGKYFAYGMFSGCSGETFAMNSNFNLPTGITSVGNCFAAGMFSGCSGSAFTMNAGFNLPAGISTVGNHFAFQMFSNCSGSVFAMNAGFNLPIGISTVGENFAGMMFYNCSGSSFTMNNDFNLPTGIITVDNNFAYSMFRDCSGSSFSMNAGFNLPAGISTVGDYFAGMMFSGCSGSSFTMNAGFNLPAGIITVGDYFAFEMFYDCSGSEFTMNESFNLPSGITKVGNYFSTNMFNRCSGVLFTMNESLNLPTGITSVGINFTSGMFAFCSGSAFQVNSVFAFPRLSRTELDKSNVFYRTFYNLGSNVAQSRTAQSIINGNETPNGNRETFASSACFSDLVYIPVNCGGSGQIPAVISISKQPAATTILPQGSAGTLSVEATITESAELSYQWYSNSTNSNTGGSIIADATGASLGIPATLAVGTHYYYCVVSATKGASSVASSVAAVEVAEHLFQIEVTTTAANQSFSLPTSGGGGGGYSKSYHWNIDWGDGIIETKTGSSNYTSAGIAHNYAAVGAYTISVTPAGSIDAWLAAFGFSYGSDGANVQANKDMLTKVISPLTPLMTRTQAQLNSPTGTQPSYEWAYTFYHCRNLSMGDDFTFAPAWSVITKVGDYFAYLMFGSCSGASFTMGNAFNLPTGIRTVGNYFACNMFFNCSGAAFTIGNAFNLPTGITTVGNSFAYCMFRSCSGAAFTMGNAFNLPVGITSVGNTFAYSMFEGCSGEAFTMNAGFNLPVGISTVGSSFASNMFSGCSGAAFRVNSVFTFPQLSSTELDKSNVFSQTFYNLGSSAVQSRTAQSIINGNETPSANKQTFTGSTCFNDLAYISANWGGGGQIRAVISISKQPAAALSLTQECINSSLSVEATATESAVLSYQWYSNSINSNTGGSIISGAIGASFSIPATLAAGTHYYYCVVSATKGASSVVSSVAAVEVAELLIAAALQTNVACYGASTASATVTPSGGVAPYIYAWSGSSSTAATAAGLTTGNYTCTITDANNCTITKDFSITEPVALTASIIQTAVPCNGVSDGVALVTPSGGTAPYTYEWLPSGGTDATAGNLAAGNYTCTITDAKGCVENKDISISEHLVPTLTKPENQTLCAGTSTAAVDFNGDVMGTTYTWTNTNTPIGLAASGSGNIASFIAANTGSAPQKATIIVTPSANGCDGVAQNFSITVNPITQIAAQPVGGEYGSVSNLSVAATGTGTLTYVWSDGTNTISTDVTYIPTGGWVVAGNYSVTVSGNCGNSVTSHTATVAPKAIAVTAIAEEIEYGQIPLLEYQVDPSLIDGDQMRGSLSVDNLEVGEHTILQNDLTAGPNYTITYEPATLTILPAGGTNLHPDLHHSVALSVYPNPTKSELVVKANGETATGTIQLCDLAGRVVFTAKTNPFDITHLPKGLYLLKVNGSVVKVTKK
jgi:hypothetical protein